MRAPFVALGFSALMLTAAPVAAEGLYAAIAFSPQTGQSGGSWNYDSEATAETEAYASCGAEDCGTVLVFQQCGAVAVGDGYGMGFAGDLSSAVAQEAALASCGEFTTGCQVTLSFCNEGY